MRRFIVVMLTVLGTAGSASADDPALRLWATHPELASKIVESRSWLEQSERSRKAADAQKKGPIERPREWTSADGKFKTTAVFFGFVKEPYADRLGRSAWREKKDEVKLWKPAEKKAIHVKLDRLCEADREWIRAETKKARSGKR